MVPSILVSLVGLIVQRCLQCSHQGRGKFIAEGTKAFTAAAVLYPIRNKENISVPRTVKQAQKRLLNMDYKRLTIQKTVLLEGERVKLC